MFFVERPIKACLKEMRKRKRERTGTASRKVKGGSVLKKREQSAQSPTRTRQERGGLLKGGGSKKSGGSQSFKQGISAKEKKANSQIPEL